MKCSFTSHYHLAHIIREVIMAITGKYGRIDIPKIGADEPIFILRAQDSLAEPTIEMYMALTRSHGIPMADSLQEEIEAFSKWDGKKKLPD
jgi:hypothetical protein